MSEGDWSPLRKQLFEEILMARQRVYEVAPPTALERLELPIDAEVYIKREDLSPIHAYKWRGAYNAMATLSAEQRAGGVICASAGNHAQGVALAAKRMGVSAKIFMPRSTPRMKQLAVKRHGGENVEIVLHGDTYDAASDEAKRVGKEERRTYVHPYDDLKTMGGQGTLADEVVMAGLGHFDIAYVQIGGGGLAAAVACWLKHYYPGIRIIGVEGVDQASMAAAVRAGGPVTLPYVDVFADGTAVKRAGDLTWQLCAELIDEFITVTNDELCAAIQHLWEARRAIPEPAGAMGLAGLLKDPSKAIGKRVLTILCGANMDFSQLGLVAHRAGIGARRRRYYRFTIGERNGTLLDLVEKGMEGVSIVDFQYGKVHAEVAHPVIGFEAGPMELELMTRRLVEFGIPFEDVTSQEDVEFRMIHYDSALFAHPWFIKLEFPERAGALRDFLRAIRSRANICYFNYSYSGERVGRALLGFEFLSAEARAEVIALLKDSPWNWVEMNRDVLGRIV